MFDPRLYRLLHTGTPGDVDFYRAACRGARTVLELGCGDARVAAAIAADGREVVGLDAHPGMLALAPKVAGLSLVEGDLRDFDLGRRFDRILLPYCSLYCVDRAGQRAALRCAARHLAPEGQLLFDGYLLPGEPEAGEDAPSWLTTLVDGPRLIEVLEHDRHWPRESRCEVTYVHHIRGEGPVREVRYTLTHVYLWPEDVVPLLEDAGLRFDGLWGGFEGEPLNPESEHMVARARLW